MTRGTTSMKRARRALVTLAIAAAVVPLAATTAAAVATDDSFRAIAGVTTALNVGANDALLTPPSTGAYWFAPLSSPTATVTPPPPVVGNMLVVSQTTANGALVESGLRTMNYTAPVAFTGTDGFSYAIFRCDFVALNQFGAKGWRCGGTEVGRAAVTVAVEANAAPIANDDTESTHLPTPVLVLGNDTDPNGSIDTLRVVNDSGSTAAGGSFFCDDSVNRCEYTPPVGFTGTDQFSYRSTDRAGAVSNPATVTISVTADRAPVAVDDTVTVHITTDGRLLLESFSITANDIDPDGDPVFGQLMTNPANGRIVCDFLMASCTYEPADLLAPVNDSFTYRVDDTFLTSATATVNVVIQSFVGVTAADDTATVDPGVTTVIDVSANDGAVGTITAVTQPASGSGATVTCTTTTCSYHAGISASTDSFTYVRSDGLLSVVATVTVTVRNIDPVVLPQIATTRPDTPIDIALASFVNDPNFNVTNLQVHTPPLHGSATCAALTCTYTPATGYAGSDVFSYQAIDALGAMSNAATVTIDVNPAGGTSGNLVGTTNNVVTSGLTDPTTHPLATNVSASGISGPVTITEGAATGTPPAGYSFFGQAAVITAPTGTVDNPFEILFVLDPSLIPTGLTVNDVTVVRNGVPVADCANPTVRRADPTPCVYGRFGDATSGMRFGVYTVAASTWNFAQRSLNQPPTCARLTMNVIAGTTASVAASCNDADSPTLTYAASAATKGAVVVQGNQLKYTAPITASGTDTFTYTASDGQATSTPATVTVTIIAPTGLNLTVTEAEITPATRTQPADVEASGRFSPVAGAKATCGESVTINIAGLAQTIAGNKFRTVSGKCVYTASSGAYRKVTLDFAKGLWSAEGTGPQPTAVTNPVRVQLTIGDDPGTATATFMRHGSGWSYPS